MISVVSKIRVIVSFCLANVGTEFEDAIVMLSSSGLVVSMVT